MFDDSRVESELLRREFHRNEMETTPLYRIVGGGVTLSVADTREQAEVIQADLKKVLICDVSIDVEYV